MKIVIDIPDGMYEAYKDRPPMFGDEGLDSICKAIANGTPLPKGHGDLIDRTQALRTDCFGDGHSGLRAFHEYADYAKMRKYLKNIDVIIPADVEESEYNDIVE